MVARGTNISTELAAAELAARSIVDAVRPAWDVKRMVKRRKGDRRGVFEKGNRKRGLSRHSWVEIE